MKTNILERQVGILKYNTKNTCTHLGIVIQIQSSSTSLENGHAFGNKDDVMEIVHFSKKKGTYRHYWKVFYGQSNHKWKSIK